MKVVMMEIEPMRLHGEGGDSDWRGGGRVGILENEGESFCGEVRDSI